MEFQWETGNLKHIMEDYPDRGNSVEEVESVFSDPYFDIKPSRTEADGEPRFQGTGIGLSGTVRSVIFVFRDNQIRPISCWPSNRRARKSYYESIRQKEDGNQE
jgi:uncharacterized DUF497 family protein